MHRTLLSGLGAALLATVSVSQSPLVTLFANNNSGNVGGTIYFDLEIPGPLPIWVHAIDLNLNSPPGTPGVLNVHVCSGGRYDYQRSPGMWTLIAAAPLVAAGPGAPTPVGVPPFVLCPGRYGIAYQVAGVAHAYTNGTGFNQVHANADMTLRCGEACNGAFAGATVFSPRVVNTAIHYAFGGPCPSLAAAARYGRSCGIPGYASFYEHFSFAAGFDLAFSAMTLLYAPGGYTAVPGGAFVPPSPAAVVLPLGDDTEVAMPLASLMRVPGQPATPAIAICSNGFVSVAAGNGTPYTPSREAFLAMPQTVWGSWHDYNPAAAGSGPILFEEVGAVSYITWLGVADFGVPGSASTFQLQLDRGTGNVVYVWGAMSLTGNGHLVGYSPGGASADPDNVDLSLALPLVTTTVDNAPRLSPVTTPRSAAMLAFDTTDIPAGTAFELALVGFMRFPAGIDLAATGMPRCRQYVSPDLTEVAIPVGGVAPHLLAIPADPVFLGAQFGAQSVTFTPGANALGVLASNGLALTVGAL